MSNDPAWDYFNDPANGAARRQAALDAEGKADAVAWEYRRAEKNEVTGAVIRALESSPEGFIVEDVTTRQGKHFNHERVITFTDGSLGYQWQLTLKLTGT
jgi:hypothetical protein